MTIRKLTTLGLLLVFAGNLTCSNRSLQGSMIL
jgi:hypothetical protein